jgi:acetyl esterase/lipase
VAHVPPDDLLTRPAALPEAVLRYGAHADALVELHLPRAGGPRPLVVLVHGGFWKQAYDRVHARPMARALAAAGAVVALPEYRRVGPPDPHGTGQAPGAGGWPTTAQDVEAAVTALPGLLEGLGVTTTSTTLAGHSAGGHLVLWLASRPVAGGARVIALAPVADLRAAAGQRLGDGATQAFLGGEPAERPDVYAAADPLTLLAAPATPTAREVRLLHGTADDAVPPAQSRSLAAAQPTVVLDELAGADHFDVIDPTSAAWPRVRAALLGEPAAG